MNDPNEKKLSHFPKGTGTCSINTVYPMSCVQKNSVMMKNWSLI